MKQAVWGSRTGDFPCGEENEKPSGVLGETRNSSQWDSPKSKSSFGGKCHAFQIGGKRMDYLTNGLWISNYLGGKVSTSCHLPM